MPPALRFARVTTELGPMLAAALNGRLVALSRGTELTDFLADLARRYPLAERLPASVPDTEAWVRGYLDGSRRDLPPVDLEGLPAFDVDVYEAVRAVPYGTTATYGEIAAAIGRPRAARAVGSALARCPLFPAVPCHRIVRAADGVSGWGGSDLTVKRRLLQLEAAPRRG